MEPKASDSDVVYFLKSFAKRYTSGGVGELSSESTYYFILGLVPFMIFLVNCILFFAAPHMRDIMEFMKYLPAQFAQSMEGNIQRIVEGRSSIWLVVGLAGTVWTASRGMSVLIQGMDRIYFDDRNLQSFVAVNSKSIFFTALLVFSLILTLVLIVFANGLVHAINFYFGLPDIFWYFWRPGRYLIPFAMMGFTLSLFYRFAAKRLPDWLVNKEPSTKWVQILFASFVVTVALLALSGGYGYYVLNISSMGVTYGSLIGLIFLFLWFHLAAQIILAGGSMIMAWGDLEEREKKERSAV